MPLVHHELVFLHVIESCKLHPALGTGMRPLPHMGAKVSVEVVFANETPPALQTGERGTLRCVHILLVLSQDEGPSEALATELTLIGPLLVVNCLRLCLKATFYCAAILAQLADKGPLAGVRPLVHRDVGSAVARVGAMRALVLAHWPLSVLVSPVPVMPLLG